MVLLYSRFFRWEISFPHGKSTAGTAAAPVGGRWWAQPCLPFRSGRRSWPKRLRPGGNACNYPPRTPRKSRGLITNFDHLPSRKLQTRRIRLHGETRPAPKLGALCVGTRALEIRSSRGKTALLNSDLCVLCVRKVGFPNEIHNVPIRRAKVEKKTVGSILQQHGGRKRGRPETKATPDEPDLHFGPRGHPTQPHPGGMERVPRSRRTPTVAPKAAVAAEFTETWATRDGTWNLT